MLAHFTPADRVARRIANDNPKPLGAFYAPGLRDRAASAYLARKAAARASLRSSLAAAAILYGAAVACLLIGIWLILHAPDARTAHAGLCACGLGCLLFLMPTSRVTPD